MRSFIIVPCLVAATIVLQGCGGGGTTPPPPGPGPVTKDCVNPEIDVKSQSFTSTAKSTETSSSGNITTKEVLDSVGTIKIDMEQMNLYENVVSTISTTVLWWDKMISSMDLKMEEKIIVDVSKKVVVISVKVSNATSGKVLITNCSAITIPAMPSAAEVSILFKAVVVPGLQKVATCSGNDGVYDHYDMKINLQGVSIPGLKDNSYVTVQGMETILLDKDYVMHSTTGSLKGEFVLTKYEGLGIITVDEKVDSTTTDAKAGGPTAADLDYSSWTQMYPDGHSGKCTEIHYDPPHTDISKFFQPTKLSGITNKFRGVDTLQGVDKLTTKAFFRNQLLAAIQAAMKATETKKIIV